MRVFSYVVKYDYAFAPNPFHGFCTLATFKPQIRAHAQRGDWVMGTGSADASRNGYLVFAMEVSEVISFDEYWADPRFRRKIPRTDRALKYGYGDNIYHRDGDKWIQADSRHSLEDGSANDGHVNTDTSVDRVLVGTAFSYFGGYGPAVPKNLRTDFERDLVHQRQGHSVNFPSTLVDEAVSWFRSLEQGALGYPTDWSRL
jgi:hypothetical protein